MKVRVQSAIDFRCRRPTCALGRIERALACWVLMLLVTNPARAEDPAPFVPDLAPLRDEALWPLPGHDSIPLPPGASATEHARALRADPLHGHQFIVREIAGTSQASRVVFLIPQFHRNPLMPIGWTSLGTAIMEVQSNLDILVSRLTRLHGVRCVGSEGNWLLDMGYPPELRQAAQWHHDLAQRKSRALVHLKKEPILDSTQEIAADLEEIYRILTQELRRHVRILDGAGIALSRRTGDEEEDVHRFGIEDPQLNQRALQLLAERRRVDEELAKHMPSSQSAVADAMGAMWLDEISAYEKDVLRPLQETLDRADRLRLHLRQANALDAAEGLGRFVALAKHVRAAVIQPDEIAQYTDYYREVSTAAINDAPTQSPHAPPPPANDSVRIRLEAEREKLQAAYEQTTFTQREAAATRILWERMGDKESCALIMGAAHLEGLQTALLEISGGKIGIITITPYDFDTGHEAGEESDK